MDLPTARGPVQVSAERCLYLLLSPQRSEMMPDPFTIAAVGGIVLTEGVKFLYAQASDIIKRWHDRRSKEKTASEATKLPENELASVPAAKVTEILDGQLSPPEIHYEQVEKVYEPLKKLRNELV